MKKAIKNKKNINLIASILFATIAISGSVVFLGLQMSKAGVSQQSIEKGIENYIAKMQKQQADLQKEEENQVEKQAKNVPPVRKTDYIRGNKNALITLIEYSDFECPYCKKFHQTAMELIEKYPDKVNWIYRHFPLAFHDPLATKQAEATECAGDIAGNDIFWKFSDAIFEKTRSNGRGMTEEDLFAIAKDLGINEIKFKKCMDSRKYLNKIQKDIEEGANAGITGTPGNIFINNKTGEVSVVSGAQPLYMLEQAMNELTK